MALKHHGLVPNRLVNLRDAAHDVRVVTLSVGAFWETRGGLNHPDLKAHRMAEPGFTLRQVHVPRDGGAPALGGGPRKDARAAGWDAQTLVGQGAVIFQEAVSFWHASDDVRGAVEHHRRWRTTVVALFPTLVEDVGAEGVFRFAD